jgi:hypothetical protein
MRALLCCLILTPFFLNAQENSLADSLVNSGVVKDTSHSPRKATLYSALLPGAGQVYNHLAMPKGKKKAFWKVPLIYAGLGVTGYFALQNNIEQRKLKQEYTYRIENGTPNPENTDLFQYDNQSVLILYQNAERSRDLMIFAFIAVYALNILDAHVSAHFVNFDVSKDLTLNIRPSLQQLNSPGLALTLNFR